MKTEPRWKWLLSQMLWHQWRKEDAAASMQYQTELAYHQAVERHIWHSSQVRHYRNALARLDA